VNNVYRLVWSRVLRAWVVAGENARGCGKGSGRALTAAALSLVATAAHAGPLGEQVTAGSADVLRSGATTTIKQSTQNVSIKWDSFNVGQQETVNFVQPSASALAVNRIYDTNGSQILGRLNANGQVYLINPNGVLFGQGSQVNVGGLVASTLDLNDATLAGNARSFGGSGKGSVINKGTLTAANGGYVALLGNSVSNQGTISARLGTVALAGGSAATLTFNGNSLVQVQVDQSTLNNLAENRQLISADGGQVIMTAGAKNALLASVVNNTGVIQAHTVENRGGTIVLLAGMTAGQTHVDGTLDASAPTGGNGGFIETSAAHVKVADSARVTTLAADGHSGTWLIDPVDFTIAAGSGALTTSGIGATALSNSLASGNVAIATDGATGGNGDIFVNSAVSWSANKLTLSAHRNIAINADLNGSGTAQLALEYGQASAAGAGTGYSLGKSAKVNLPAGANFSTKQGSGGATTPWTVITSLGVEGDATVVPATMTLQGMAAGPAGQPRTGNYVLGADIDASGTAGWNGGLGFTPVGDDSWGFTGTLDGLGHTINALKIARPAENYVGLFRVVHGAVRNLGLVGGSVSGGSMSVGVLAGYNGGTISNAYATGSVSGQYRIGGLVGENWGTINDAYASGSVNGYSYVGGLVGYNDGTIANAYATGSVFGATTDVGGLVGSHISGGSISYAYATGSVSSTNNVGGLVGNSSGGPISNTYATGTVTGSTNVGGLVGNLTGWGPVSYSYATGSVTPTPTSGGLVGAGGGTATASFWDTQTTRQATSAGGAGAVGKTTAQMKQLATFAGWDIDDAGGTGKIWRIYGGNTSPLLRSFLTPLAATAGSQTVTYNGTTESASTYTVAAHDPLLLNGTAVATASGRDAGTYALNLTGLWSTQQGYDLIVTGGTFTIDKANLTISTGNVTKTYDGDTTANGSAVATAGTLFSTDFLSGGSFAFLDPDAGTGRTVTVAGVTVNDGNSGNNYNVTYADNTSSTIARKALTISGTTAADKTYDGTPDATMTAGALSGLVGNETLGVSATGVFDSKNAGNRSATASYTLADGLGGMAANYSLDDTTGHAATIQKANLTISTGNVTKTYNGTTAAAGSAVATGGTQLFGGDTFSGGSFAFTDKKAGSGKTVTVAGVTVNDGNSGNNYNVTYAANTNSTINKANLTISIGNVTKTYDGTTVANGSAVATGGTQLFGGDTLSGGNFAFLDADAGTGRIVTVAGVSVNDGNSGNNYNVTYADNTSSTIAQKALTISGTTAADKTYDGTATATMTAGALSGMVGSETVGVSATGVFDSKNAGSRSATASYTLADGGNGGMAVNYILADTTGHAATIQKAVLTISGTTAADKTYDGTATATMTAGALSGLVGNESLGVTATGVFDSRNAGNRSATASYTLADGAGALAANYSLAGTTGHAATIQQAALTISGITAADKTYDGTTSATANTAAAVLTGKVAGDDVTVSATGAFADRNVGTAKTVTLASTYGGVDVGNYSITGQASTAANITPATLTYAATPATFLVGQVPALLSGSVMGLVGGDTLAGVTSGTVTWSSPATAASGAGQYAISGGGLAATNYVLAQAPGNASALTLAQATAPARVLHVLSALQAASKQPPQGDIDPPLKTIVIAELGSGVPCEHDAAKRELSLNSRGNAVTVQVVSCGVRMPLDPAKNN
jgi:filamentous hemagglutinin family protein